MMTALWCFVRSLIWRTVRGEPASQDARSLPNSHRTDLPHCIKLPLRPPLVYPTGDVIDVMVEQMGGRCVSKSFLLYAGVFSWVPRNQRYCSHMSNTNRFTSAQLRTFAHLNTLHCR